MGVKMHKIFLSKQVKDFNKRRTIKFGEYRLNVASSNVEVPASIDYVPYFPSTCSNVLLNSHSNAVKGLKKTGSDDDSTSDSSSMNEDKDTEENKKEELKESIAKEDGREILIPFPQQVSIMQNLSLSMQTQTIFTLANAITLTKRVHRNHQLDA